MMTAAFAALGLPHRYVLADVAPADVPATVTRLRAADAGGANVTVPHKAAVAALMDALSDDAREAQAVNVVVADGSRLVGHNTDLPATVDALRRLCPDGIDRAVVLGAGGAGRAVQLALVHVGAGRVSILRRSDGSMARLADELAGADLLVNATPVGTGSDDSPVPPALLRAGPGGPRPRLSAQPHAARARRPRGRRVRGGWGGHPARPGLPLAGALARPAGPGGGHARGPRRRARRALGCLTPSSSSASPGSGKSTVGRLLAPPAWPSPAGPRRRHRVARGRRPRAPHPRARRGRHSARSSRPCWPGPARSPGAVIATGGGAVVDPLNRWRLWEAGTVAWLDAPDEVLLARLAAHDEERPMLDGDAGRPAGRAADGPHRPSTAPPTCTWTPPLRPSRSRPRSLAAAAIGRPVARRLFDARGAARPSHGPARRHA